MKEWSEPFVEIRLYHAELQKALSERNWRKAANYAGAVEGAARSVKEIAQRRLQELDFYRRCCEEDF
jgi:hypothetical protein